MSAPIIKRTITNSVNSMLFPSPATNAGLPCEELPEGRQYGSVDNTHLTQYMRRFRENVKKKKENARSRARAA
jgi:hypothetical protein